MSRPSARKVKARRWTFKIQHDGDHEAVERLFAWPKHVRYAMWTSCGTATTGYVEMTCSSVPPMIHPLPTIIFTKEQAKDRAATKQQIVDLATTAGKAPVEYGSWEAGNMGRRKNTGVNSCQHQQPTALPHTATSALAAGNGCSESNLDADVALEIARLKQMIDSQQQRIQQLENHPRQSVTITQNNYLIINSFGKETLALDQATLEKRFLGQTDGLIKTIQDVHFNDMYPENRNVKMRSVKKSLAERFVDGQWTVEPMEKSVNALIRNGYRLLISVWRPDSKFFNRVMADEALSVTHAQWMSDMLDWEGKSRKSCIVRARQAVRAFLLSSKP